MDNKQYRGRKNNGVRRCHGEQIEGEWGVRECVTISKKVVD